MQGDVAGGVYVSLSEAGRLIGFKGSNEAVAKRLRRVLLAKEREKRTSIMVRAGGNGCGRRYLVTRYQLQKHLPECFSRRDKLADVLRAELRTAVAQFEKEQEYTRQKVEHYAKRVGEVMVALRSLQSRRQST